MPSLQDPGSALLETLKDLRATGVLQEGNQLSLEDLINIPEEEVLEDATDEEIFEAVQQMHGNRENQEENNGDDDGSPTEPRPTRKEALQALAMLSRFFEDVDGPFARMLEGSLTKFGRETRLEQSRSLVSTSITDYFAPKTT
ncbi:hypothetical protein B0H14DRAFT_2339412 [Mycena olivaceomarginata]|nr:hypothetical protein B0H14DRAFT_2389759 [Mycena olivaceomarginata]KAJ7883730.1 hypothetical protein B0H14DRAFT_2339412 [Mycena olivaceomarginata]